jgi:hypothetical protein
MLYRKKSDFCDYLNTLMNYKVPYDFILRYLYPVRPQIRKMLGGYALILKDDILLLLRERENQPEFNGVFVPTEPQFFDELSRDVHSSNMDFDIDGAPHTWIFISEDLTNFHEVLQKACELIKAGDKRIGKPHHA